MVPPTLSRIERERIAEAVRAGAVKWRALGLRLTYLAGGREHLILSAGNWRVFRVLCEQAAREVQQISGGQHGNDSVNAA